jgi:hypothetical protein
MGLKGKNKGQSVAAMVEPEPEPFEMETADMEIEEAVSASADADTDADTDTDTDTKPGRRRGRKPGQSQERGPQLEWTYEREEALARVLKAPKTLGDIRTARSVADALAQDPAFEDEPLLTPVAVKAWVDLIKKMYADQNREHPAYLNFDRLRKRVPTMALFELEDEAAGDEA